MNDRKSDASLNQFIGGRLFAAREAARLTQQDIADAIGVSRQQIARYESGETPVAAVTLATYANLLGRPLPYFYPLNTRYKGQFAFATAEELHKIRNEIRKLLEDETEPATLRAVRHLLIRRQI